MRKNCQRFTLETTLLSLQDNTCLFQFDFATFFETLRLTENPYLTDGNRKWIRRLNRWYMMFLLPNV